MSRVHLFLLMMASSWREMKLLTVIVGETFNNYLVLRSDAKLRGAVYTQGHFFCDVGWRK